MEACPSGVGANHRQVDLDGYALMAGIFQAGELEQIRLQLCQVLNSPDAAVIQSKGAIVGARNLLQTWPGVADVARCGRMRALLTEILGPQRGLVRALYFDKPPTQTWCLPWHKDLTIAVRDNRRPSGALRNPTVKAGVPHVEASRAILESMLIARIHLDAVTEENGPMTIIPGSHRSGKVMDIDERNAKKILCGPGDVLLIRPLVAHNSLGSRPGNSNHRRILHLEFAACCELPDGYEWHDFVSI